MYIETNTVKASFQIRLKQLFQSNESTSSFLMKRRPTLSRNELAYKCSLNDVSNQRARIANIEHIQYLSVDKSNENETRSGQTSDQADT